MLPGNHIINGTFFLTTGNWFDNQITIFVRSVFRAPKLLSFSSNLFRNDNLSELQLIIIPIVSAGAPREPENSAAFEMPLCEQQPFPTERKMHSRLEPCI